MEVMYRQDGNLWVPGPHTLGPYPGSQHGGPVAAVLTSRIEALAKELDAGVAMMVNVCQLRPAPLEPAEISTAIIRDGKRSTYLEGTIAFAGKPTARATAVFAKILDVKSLPAFQDDNLQPENLPALGLPFSMPDPSYGSALDIRIDGDIVWLRLKVPALENQTELVNLMTMADMSPGASMISTNTNWRKQVLGFPTLDLTVHLTRPPVGEWVGIRAVTHWFSHGLGMTESALLDQRGPLGRIAQSLVIIPHEEKG